jgi:hypothetical protein
MKVEAAVAVVVDLPAPPRSADDGVVIFACEHQGTSFVGKRGFLTTVKDPPKGPPPVCPTCGKAALHVGHSAAQRILSGG